MQTEAAALYTAALAACEKLNRNLGKLTFASMCKGEPDPFLAFSDLIYRLTAQRDAALAKWTQAAASLTTDEVVAIVSGAQK